MKGPVPMIGRVVGAALGGAIGKQNNENPIIGAAVGAVAMVAARKLLPARVAVLGAAVATGYVTRKLAHGQNGARRRWRQRRPRRMQQQPRSPFPSRPWPVASGAPASLSPTNRPRHAESFDKLRRALFQGPWRDAAPQRHGC